MNPVATCLVLLVVEVSCLPRDLYAGSKCTNPDAPGTCTLVTKCTVALKAIKNKGFHDYTRCGFDSFIEIVCCPDEDVTEDPIKVRRPDVVRRSKKACDAYSKDLPIVLSYHIVGGENANPGEFPHMAALGFYNKVDLEYTFGCGGTLISERYILTAAHCIINVQQNDLKIARLGVIKVPGAVKTPDPDIDYDVVNFTVHHDYKRKQQLNDIALIKLEKKVTFNENIRPACLYSKDDDPESLIVTGWGVNSDGERSERLQKASLTPVAIQECNSTYWEGRNRYITKTQLCALDTRSDTCEGDSGGPIQTQTNNSLMSIVGITSQGVGCGSKYPGIYTRINNYIFGLDRRNCLALK